MTDDDVGEGEALRSREIAREAIDLIEQGLIWLPGLATKLAASEWAALARRCSISPLDYGTDRVRLSDRAAPRNVFVEIRPPQAESNPAIIVEHPFRSEDYYRTLDLSFYATNDLSSQAIERKVLAALNCLVCTPDIASAVRHLVRVIHILKPPGPAYDVSHSDPDVPFSVFVSLPSEENARGCMRLAEAILHEAMHLQLTLLEGHSPVVRRSEATIYSPWKGTVRPVQGVMHGLYVFGVIDAFLEVLQGSPDHGATNYILDRREQIAEEVAQVTSGGQMEDLTEFGALLENVIASRFA